MQIYVDLLWVWRYIASKIASRGQIKFFESNWMSPEIIQFSQS